MYAAYCLLYASHFSARERSARASDVLEPSLRWVAYRQSANYKGLAAFNRAIPLPATLFGGGGACPPFVCRAVRSPLRRGARRTAAPRFSVGANASFRPSSQRRAGLYRMFAAEEIPPARDEVFPTLFVRELEQRRVLSASNPAWQVVGHTLIMGGSQLTAHSTPETFQLVRQGNALEISLNGRRSAIRIYRRSRRSGRSAMSSFRTTCPATRWLSVAVRPVLCRSILRAVCRCRSQRRRT